MCHFWWTALVDKFSTQVEFLNSKKISKCGKSEIWNMESWPVPLRLKLIGWGEGCNRGGGGTDLERGYGDVLRSWPPFFRPVSAPQPTSLRPMCRSCAPHFQFLEKKKTQTFPNFHSQDPLFFKENSLPRPYFWKPVWHIPTKIKLSAPPRCNIFSPIMGIFT